MVIYRYVERDDNRLHRVVAFVYVSVMTMDTCLEDSLVGVVMLGILLFNLVRPVKGSCKTVVHLFLDAVITAEVISVMSLMEIFDTNSIVRQDISGIGLDIVFVLVVVISLLTGSEKFDEDKVPRILMPVAALLLDLVCIVAMGFAIYARNTTFSVTTADIIDGTSVYIADANTDSLALTCDNGTITAGQATGADNQIFTFEKSEEDRYWHIVASDGTVMDISLVQYAEGNTVIAYEENGVDGQHWQVEDMGYNMVRFVSHDPGFRLTWGNHTEEDGLVLPRTLITANPEDGNTYFVLKNADAANTPLIGWMTYGNRTLVLIAYMVLMVVLTLLTAVSAVVEARKK